MSNIKDEAGGLKASDIEYINGKRIVFIVDEAHRSTFGDMLITIKTTFPKAIFFGFTGTPIQDENQKKKNTTTTVFGNELHRYSIADGIRDKNVLGFDPYKVLTFKDKDVRKVVALEKAKAKTEEEAISDPLKSKVYYKYMDAGQVGMVGHFDNKGDYIKGIEDYIPNVQYQTEEHTTTVVKDILENWVTLSHNSKFHAIFATSSIPEAINYYRMIKEMKPELKVTALFDPNIDNGGGVAFKEAGLVEIIEDYNERYGQDFEVADVASDSILASVAGPFAYLLVPIVGVVSWQLAAAAVTGFIAKENVVGTLAVCFVGLENLIDTDSLELMQGAGAEVAGVFAITKVAALAYLMFNLYTPPCFAALGAMHSEINDRKWFWGGVGLQFATGFTVAFLVYQIGTLITTGSVGAGFFPGLIAVVVFVFIIAMMIRKTNKSFAAEYALSK